VSGATRDDELLDVLAASLGPPPDAEPTWAEISHLHRVIDTRRGLDGRTRTPLWRVRRPLTAALAGFLVLGGASAAAAASGAVMPEPVRVAARAVGVPVDSPSLAEAKAAMATLRHALDGKNPNPAAIRAHAQHLREALAKLSADDRSSVQDEAAFLLAAADAALAPPPAPLGSPAPGSPSAGAPGPESPKAAPAGDDHGGGPGQSADPERSGTGSDNGHSGDDHGGSAATPSASSNSGPGSSGSSGDGEHTATTVHADNSGHDGGSDGSGGGSSDGGSSHGGGSDGGSSGSDGGHSGQG